MVTATEMETTPEQLAAVKRWAHFVSTIENEEPKLHLHNVIPNISRNRIPKIVVPAIAGTAFDPRRYRPLRQD